MDTHRLVVTEDLNQYGYLYGGRLLSWVDEASFIAASLEYPQARFVTVAMDEVLFAHSIQNGTILTISCVKKAQGRTSVTYRVEVYRGRVRDGHTLFSTCVTFVNIDSSGKKSPLPVTQ